MMEPLIVAWAIGSVGVLAVVLAARFRRAALARELHELRGALTSARLAVDLMPVLGIDKESVCRAASSELERSYAALGEFEDLLHARLSKSTADRRNDAGRSITRRSRFEAVDEIERLRLIWSEEARRQGREFKLEWFGPVDGIFVHGSKQRLTEVMTNLISNAFEHGAGRVTIVGRMRSDSLRLEVRDQGRGLDRPLAALVRRGRGRGRHGHGLGVATRAARRLGGSISSAPASEGAALVLTVPAVHDPSAMFCQFTDDDFNQFAEHTRNVSSAPVVPLGPGTAE